jgi:catechol 2,3-dioxygenase-like lactoylglutathione lyase family enzyme
LNTKVLYEGVILNTGARISVGVKSNSLVPELSITDYQKTLHFYKEVLGFTIEYQREEEGFAYLSLGESQIMIDQIGLTRTWMTGDLEYPFGRGINLQIEVPDVNSLLIRLKQNSISLFMELEEKWYQKDDIEVGNKQFLVQDPDGYLLRFFEDLGTRKPR